MNIKGTDMIRTEDVIGWIEWNRNPATASIVGNEMLDDMVNAAVKAVQNISKNGMVMRSDAVSCINEAIPESAPVEMDSYRKGYWNTLRATIRESMGYPAPIVRNCEKED